MQRRIFIKRSALFSTGIGLVGASCGGGTSSTTAEADTVRTAGNTTTDPLFRISLAEWSFHNALFNPELFKSGWDAFGDKLKNDYDFVVANAQMTNMEFPVKAAEMGFEGVEFVNTFFFDKAENAAYLAELKEQCATAGVQPLIIMCDAEGELGNPNETARKQAVENHYKWVDAARALGCHSIRVNAQSEGSYEEQQKLAADGLAQLGDYADGKNINVIVENHGGLSSNGEWLAGVMKLADHPRVGTLPDFGNFCIQRPVPTEENPRPEGCEEEYDRYEGVTELMPYAEAVSAKTHDFDEQGQEIHTDYERMMRIVLDAGYRGFVGVEYEGSEMPEEEGILASKRLLEQVREKLAPVYG